MRKAFEFIYFLIVAVPLCIVFTIVGNLYLGLKWLFALK